MSDIPPFSSSMAKLRLDHFLDDVLIEIFHRLPLKFSLRCMTVCKRWSRLISSTEFLSRFVLLHCRLFSQSLQRQESSHIVDMRNFFIIPKAPAEALGLGPFEGAFSLSFLAGYKPKGRVLCCSNGLLLCVCPKQMYSVCNPVSKDWVKPPSPPEIPTNFGLPLSDQMGFMCDSYYGIEGDEKVVLASQRKFLVVIVTPFLMRPDQLTLRIFSSDTGHWRKMIVSSPKGFQWGVFRSGEGYCWDGYDSGFCWTPLGPFHHGGFSLDGVVVNGMLYFLGAKGVLVCDPSKDSPVSHCIDDPKFGPIVEFKCDRFLGVSCESLRLCRVYRLNSSANVDLWELKDYDKVTGKGSWNFVDSISLGLDVWKNFDVSEPLPEPYSSIDKLHVSLLGLHPCHEHILYIQYQNSIFSYSLRTNNLEMLHAPGKGKKCYYSAVPVLLPWWPTPIPLLRRASGALAPSSA